VQGRDLEKSIAAAKKQSHTDSQLLLDPLRAGFAIEYLRRETGWRITLPRNKRAGRVPSTARRQVSREPMTTFSRLLSVADKRWGLGLSPLGIRRTQKAGAIYVCTFSY